MPVPLDCLTQPRPAVPDRWEVGGFAPTGDGSWLEDLTPLQRFLLATDGTVTTALAAYIGEPVGVRMLLQEQTSLAEADGALGLRARRTVLERRVVVYGTRTGVRVLYGDSRVALERLPAPVRADLLSGELPIGIVLRRHRLETFREPIGAGRRRATPEVAVQFGPGEVCWRTYAIIARRRPVMVVREEFPVEPVPRIA